MSTTTSYCGWTIPTRGDIISASSMNSLVSEISVSLNEKSLAFTSTPSFSANNLIKADTTNYSGIKQIYNNLPNEIKNLITENDYFDTDKIYNGNLIKTFNFFDELDRAIGTYAPSVPWWQDTTYLRIATGTNINHYDSINYNYNLNNDGSEQLFYPNNNSNSNQITIVLFVMRTNFLYFDEVYPVPPDYTSIAQFPRVTYKYCTTFSMNKNSTRNISFPEQTCYAYSYIDNEIYSYTYCNYSNGSIAITHSQENDKNILTIKYNSYSQVERQYYADGTYITGSADDYDYPDSQYELSSGNSREKDGFQIYVYCFPGSKSLTIPSDLGLRNGTLLPFGYYRSYHDVDDYEYFTLFDFLPYPRQDKVYGDWDYEGNHPLSN